MTIRGLLGALVARLRRVWRFITADVWDIELSSLSPRSLLGVKAVRVVYLVFKGFREDECPLHASALTFSTLMSIVPVLALSLAVARGLGADDAAKDRIRQVVSNWTASFGAHAATNAPPRAGALTPGAPPAGDDFDVQGLGRRINDLVEEGFRKVENISLAKLSALGLVLLLWMVISVLGRVESSFNRVWGVTTGRSLWRRFTDYLSILFVLPILVVAASSLPAVDFATRFLDDAAARAVRDFLGSGLLKHLTVYAMTTMAFTFVIMFMPNTRVHARAGAAGGVVAGLLFIGWMAVCAALQVGAARYGKIYGGFAIVPIILAWVFVSWEIVLLGAEVAFAVQNCATYRMEQGAEKANFRARLMLVLSVLTEAARQMMSEAGRLDVAAYAAAKGIPVRLMNDVVAELVRLGFLAELSDRQGSYVLLRAADTLQVRHVVDAFTRFGVAAGDLGLNRLEAGVKQTVDSVAAGIDEKLGPLTIRDMVGRRDQG